MPLCFQVQFQVLVTTFKALYHMGPSCLMNCLVPITWRVKIGSANRHGDQRMVGSFRGSLHLLNSVFNTALTLFLTVSFCMVSWLWSETISRLLRYWDQWCINLINKYILYFDIHLCQGICWGKTLLGKECKPIRCLRLKKWSCLTI